MTKLFWLVVSWGLLFACASSQTHWDAKCEWRALRAQSSVGVRWRKEDFPLRLMVIESELAPEYIQAIEESVHDWNTAANFNLFSVHIVSDDEWRTRGVITETNIIYIGALDSEASEAGVTRYVAGDETGYMQFAVVMLRNDLSKKKYGKIVVLHELGHVLGIDHSPNDFGNVMYPVATNTKATIRRADVRYVLSYLGKYEC